ncbi:hypothetical protein CO057_03070 [Candidatus Uhrbacteria bacterium CG_4_9_14_0_2_um_filter_41_50]|uniref:Bacterial spore germination immunoglobulin-like domain-containing protein n=1 Tax=Candidatus Uhrbacteria bacterium CG_4_9_14_0_2_um_filter_41_50 TaxID=1975031 RepID=A0A2M8ENR3_9BACT|nr:MAG: hypothetical protein COZ45_02350 [Candidatus Uhrbacteria bacterium CG_4_10_14_3_um_filter_41_21]PIZ55023.1 MAG: hypothetical protein COY24_01920 [Candidatus Uhrbacteria bacterium CG_4_10_14_0_2_um_filter_41_21]PJB84471.1 MAG: hypothetical protein CO086_03450 [Candidatus Uhrbacteria bacterium CG_4_9_14_0_8_um_filter_41_16]PJC24394.1 MAG: hypothetical protein CO057_03070 [Candidatus Uhrbacteria bacterium CG_4_9_14_0_2_um_filter_41_50]PJE74830.1 MAG: hypothetical protein COV03_03345 [Candi
MKNTLFIVSLIALLLFTTLAVWPKTDSENNLPADDATFDDSSDSADSDVITPEISYTNATQDDIIVDLPLAGDTITSPLTINGKARGSWFFEASAPVMVVNWDGLIIGEGYIQTTSDWMTADFVDFTGEITFTNPTYQNNGVIILKNDNPSGLPENDKALEIPIYFAQLAE